MIRVRLDQLGDTPTRPEVLAALRARLHPVDHDTRRTRLVCAWRRTWGWSPAPQWIAQRLAREAGAR